MPWRHMYAVSAFMHGFLPACMSLRHMFAVSEEVKSPQDRSYRRCQPCECWELQPHPLEEQPVLHPSLILIFNCLSKWERSDHRLVSEDFVVTF